MQTSLEAPYLSLIIPCFNDCEGLKKNLPPFLEYVKGLGVSFEVILSEDGGSDTEQTRAFAEGLGLRFIAGGKNQGKGAAVRRAMLQARGTYCLFTDADIPFNYDFLERFLKYLDFKEFQLVVGDRNLPTSQYHHKISLIRSIGSNLYAFVVGHFVAGGWYDTQCGAKGFRREVAQDLFSVGRIKRYGFDIELLYIALKRNYDIKRLPVCLRNQEKSHVSILRDGSRMLFDLFIMYIHRCLGHYSEKKSSHEHTQAQPSQASRRHAG